MTQNLKFRLGIPMLPYILTTKEYADKTNKIQKHRVN